MDHFDMDTPIDVGSDQGRGNLVGVQPYLVPLDYRSESAFLARLSGYMEAAAGLGWFNPRSVVVFPEYTGTWLLAADESQAVYRAASTSVAMRRLALRHPLAFARQWIAARESDRVTAALFRVKASQTAAAYQHVFSTLASRFEVSIVAGSILLPKPAVLDGVVTAGVGPLYNVSAVFGPDGCAHPRLARKAFPITSELPFVSPAPLESLPVFETPAGRLGVLVCADSWYPAAYQALKAAQVEILAVPSFLSGNGAWEQPWGGYNGADAPADVEAADVGHLSEGQAWRKYALAGRLALSGARSGINVFLHGDLWDLGSNSGQSVIVAGEKTYETQGREAALLNLWL